MLNKLPLEKKTRGKKNPEGKRWRTGVALSFTESRMQISKSKVMGAETWWGGVFQPPQCLASEQKHSTPLKHWSGIQAKSPQISLPQRETKRSIWTWFFMQNKDGPYTAPAWSSLWGGCPAPGDCIPKPGRGLSPLPYLWAGRLWEWHPALAGAFPMVWRQPLPMASGRGMTSWRQWEENVILHWRLQRYTYRDTPTPTK